MATIETVMQGFSLGTSQGGVAFCGVTLVQGSKRILVDVAHPGRRQLLMQSLKERNLTPDDIDYVLLTHAHWDHMLNIDLFPNAKILISPEEREYIKAPADFDWATMRYASSVLEALPLQEVRDGEEIDDGISVVSTPGHSKGSMALLVHGANETSCVSGDALPNTLSLSSGLPRIVFWDLEDAKASIAKLLGAAQVFYPGHDRAFRVLDGGRYQYLQPTSIQVVGWPETDDTESGPTISYGHGPATSANIVAPQRTH